MWLIHMVLNNKKPSGTLHFGIGISKELLHLHHNLIDKFNAQIDVSKVNNMYSIITSPFPLVQCNRVFYNQFHF